jgi:PAS domain S-box-containing protein
MVAEIDHLHEMRYAAILNLMPDRVFRVNRDGDNLDFKGTAEDAAQGISSDIIVGRNLREFLPPEIAQRCLAAIHQALDTGHLQTLDYQLPQNWKQNPSSELRDYEVRLVVCGNNEVLVIERDISDRKQSEIDLQRSEQRNRAFVNAIPDIMFRLHRDGTYLDARADKDTDLAIPAAEMLGRTVFEMLPPEIAKQRMFYVERALATGQTQQFEYEFLNRGEIHDYEARIVVSGKDEVLAIVRDITCRKQAELKLQENAAELTALTDQLQTLNTNLEQQVQERTAQLEQKMQELQVLNQLQDEFLHAVSHDLRTPMMGMRLVLQNLQNKAENPIALSRSVLDRMAHSLDRQLTMISSLLETHAADRHGVELHLEPINLGEFVGAIADDLEPLIAANQATLQNHVPLNLAPVPVDAIQIERVFENLLTNALHHNAQGLTLTLTAELIQMDKVKTTENLSTFHSSAYSTVPPFVLCRIQDNGVGMTQTECDLLFDRYARGSKSARSTGIGLGLYLCRQIIRAHGGHIGALSNPGNGATFWFTLPLLHS